MSEFWKNRKIKNFPFSIKRSEAIRKFKNTQAYRRFILEVEKIHSELNRTNFFGRYEGLLGLRPFLLVDELRYVLSTTSPLFKPLWDDLQREVTDPTFLTHIFCQYQWVTIAVFHIPADPFLYRTSGKSLFFCLRVLVRSNRKKVVEVQIFK